MTPCMTDTSTQVRCDSVILDDHEERPCGITRLTGGVNTCFVDASDMTCNIRRPIPQWSRYFLEHNCTVVVQMHVVCLKYLSIQFPEMLFFPEIQICTSIRRIFAGNDRIDTFRYAKYSSRSVVVKNVFRCVKRIQTRWVGAGNVWCQVGFWDNFSGLVGELCG